MHPASGVTVEGTGASRADVKIRTFSLNVIFALGSSQGVTIKNVYIAGAVNRCPGQNCGATGEAINGGSNVTVQNVRITDNGRAGIAGMRGSLKVLGSRIDHNGAAHSAPDHVSAGIKSVHPIYVSNSRVSHNAGNGIHCDQDCGAFTVQGSTVRYNTLTGIHVELDRGPTLIGHNTVQHNNTLNWKGQSGIQGVDSKNQTIRYNVLGFNGGNGILIRNDTRAGGPGYYSANVVIYGNHRHGDRVGNCNLKGVKCGR
jgi:hypothetical protein